VSSDEAGPADRRGRDDRVTVAADAFASRSKRSRKPCLTRRCRAFARPRIESGAFQYRGRGLAPRRGGLIAMQQRNGLSNGLIRDVRRLFTSISTKNDAA